MKKAVLLIGFLFLTLTNSFGQTNPKSVNGILLNNDPNLPDTIEFSGWVLRNQPGYCGVFCSGGTIKIKLKKHKTDYPYDYLYAVTACAPKSINQRLLKHMTATKLTGDEKQCYYDPNPIHRPIPSRGIPYYKIEGELFYLEN